MSSGAQAPGSATSGREGSDPFQPGDVIAGKYRVTSTLGRRRGLLLAAEHVSFLQKVAIRVVSPRAADRDSMLKLERESHALARLGSDHVARIIDVGTLEDGSLYLVRQYLEGIDLASHLRACGKLSLEVALSYILQLTEAVAETHAYGILVRELTPERLFVAHKSPGVRGGRPVLKISDLGTAKLLGQTRQSPGEESTNTALLGLSPYSSPEALRRMRDVDVRSDVWSLGAILYEMLGGRPPFGVDVVSLAIAITRDEPVDLSQLNPSVAPELAAAVRLALAKDKHDRTADTHAFAASIVRFAPPEGKVLLERIRDLAASARIRRGETEDDELEVSRFEELDEAPTGRSTHGHAKEHTAATRLAPLPDAREQTEALGFSFMPHHPLTGRPSAPPPASHSGEGSPALLLPHSTQVLAWSLPDSTSPRAQPPGSSLPSRPPPLGAPAEGQLPAAALSSQSLRDQSWRAPIELVGPMTFGPPQDESSFGRKLAMYALGGAVAAIAILTLVLLVLHLFDP